MNAVAELPAIATARLPATYEAAKTALSQCSRIDECQNWADKAAAMASYAKMAKDDSLRKMAIRIQARAVRRCGELLHQIKRANGARTDIEPREGDRPRLTRNDAATEAGLSDHQRKQALRIANINEDDFEQAIESDNPATVTQLAAQGRQAKPIVDLNGIPPEDYARATEARGNLRRLAEFCKQHDPIRIAKAYKPHEVADMRRYVHVIDAWLDQFITTI